MPQQTNKAVKEIELKSRRGLQFRLGYKYLLKESQLIPPSETHDYAIGAKQRKELKKIRTVLYLKAAIIGAGFVLLIVLPFHFTQFFRARHFEIWGYSFDFELYYSIYILLMLPPEIWMLDIVNMQAVRRLCKVYQYPSVKHDNYEEQLSLLTEAGLEISTKYLKLYEINPYVGMSKFSYYGLFILNKAKGVLSNVVMKFLVRRFLGRYALRIVTDLAGAPIYAFWDAWASHLVIKEAEIRLVSTAASKDFLEGFSDEELASVRSKIPLVIHFVVQQKRQYNFSIYTFSKELLNRLPGLDIKLEREVKLKDVMEGEEDEQKKILARLAIFGLIVDGSLSVRELLTLEKYKEEAWFPMPVSHLREIMKHYVNGEKIPHF